MGARNERFAEYEAYSLRRADERASAVLLMAVPRGRSIAALETPKAASAAKFERRRVVRRPR